MATDFQWIFKEQFSFKFQDNLKIQNKYYLLKCESYTPQNWYIGLKLNSILFLSIRCLARDQNYPGGNSKWRSGLSYITQKPLLFVSSDKEGNINVFIKTVLPWFSNIYMIDGKFHFSPTFTSNLFSWTRNKNDIV